MPSKLKGFSGRIAEMLPAVMTVLGTAAAVVGIVHQATMVWQDVRNTTNAVRKDWHKSKSSVGSSTDPTMPMEKKPQASTGVWMDTTVDPATELA